MNLIWLYLSFNIFNNLGLIKNLFEKTIKFVIDSRRFDRSLTEFQMIRSRICDIERKIYTMESMIYMTAGNKINLIKIILAI